MENVVEDELPNLSEITKRVANKDKYSAPDAQFLKKMNVVSMAGQKCEIEKFVTIRKKRKNGEMDEDTTEGTPRTREQEWRCDACNVDLIYIRKDAQRVCPDCGKSSFFQEMTKGDMIAQGYTPSTAYLYKRHNHFKTWLKRTQGKETTTIDDEVIEKVKKELKKERITDLSTVDHKKIKSILKRLRLNKYYNHCVQITTMVTGTNPPFMSQEREEALLQMFERVQKPFEDHVMGKSRQNMLSYSFLIHKFLEIMSWDEYLPYFPLLVSADKIQMQDMIWKKLCAEIGFEYIRSTM